MAPVKRRLANKLLGFKPVSFDIDLVPPNYFVNNCLSLQNINVGIFDPPKGWLRRANN